MRKKNPELFTRLLALIGEYRRQHGTSPSVRWLANAAGTSTASVSRYLNVLKDEGKIIYDGHCSVITEDELRRTATLIPIPVLGDVACGLPIYAEGNIEETVMMPAAFVGDGEFYMLRAKGESMIDAGITEGDMVMIKLQNTASPGDIVVALMEDEATLKRYYPEPRYHRVRLHPENKTMEDIIVKDCLIQGVAVKVIKDL